MINVVFLLLIFFMLAGALQTADLYEINPLTSGSETAAGRMDAEVILDQHGHLAFDGEEIDEGGLRAVISGQSTKDPVRDYRLKADGRVSTPRVIEIMELLQGAGVEYLTLLTLEQES